MQDVTKAVGLGLRATGDTLFLIGDTKGHLGQSLYLREIFGKEEGSPPPVNLADERKHGEFVRALIDARLLTACHDVSDGGLLVALAEMAMAHKKGIAVECEGDAAFWFGEDQGRYVMATASPEEVSKKADIAGIRLTRLGLVQDAELKLANVGSVPTARLSHLSEEWLPKYMEK